MYTQCPECNLTFRVSAGVLKKAAGKVRCGGCGATFNALMYLSESRPGEQPGLVSPGAPPELEAEPLADPDATPPPTAVSPEQNRELLESLKRLDESDVRIEDTGIEWRILSEDGNEDIDEVLDADATPIDEDLSGDSSGTRLDASDVFDEAASEMRFDDNTGLPDDFDHDAPAPARATEPDPEPVLSHTDTHIDIAFGDAEEWESLLDELAGEQEALTAAEPVPDEPQASEAVYPEDAPADPPASAGDVGPGDDLENELAEMDALLADAVPGAANEIETALEETERELKDSTIEEDLMAAAFESERLRLEVEEAREAAEAELELPADQNDAQGVPLGDDLEIALDPDDSIALDLDALSEDDEGIAAAFKAANEDSGEHAVDEDLSDAEAEALDELEELEELDEPEGLEELDEPEEVILEEPAALDVPEPTEEEETINRMIDEELLAVAHTDDTGQLSTIKLDEDESAEPPEAAEADTSEDEENEQTGSAVAFDIPEELANIDGGETIVMEGESIVDGSEIELHDTVARQAAEKTDAEIAELREALQKQAEAETESSDTWLDPRRMRVAVIALAVLLVVQGLHFSRTALATMPGIGDAIKPIYSAIGMPITPSWDITGWQVEASDAKGGPGVDGEDEAITIVSRVRNRSSQPLPHPLMSVSLVDRYVEPVGNRVFEPADYLLEGVQPQAFVAPGQTFNASMTIRSSNPDIYSYQLSLCYRQANSRLRCAIGAFE